MKINQDIQFWKNFDIDKNTSLDSKTESVLISIIENNKKTLVNNFVNESKIIVEIKNILIEFEEEINAKIKNILKINNKKIDEIKKDIIIINSENNDENINVVDLSEKENSSDSSKNKRMRENFKKKEREK